MILCRYMKSPADTALDLHTASHTQSADGPTTTPALPEETKGVKTFTHSLRTAERLPSIILTKSL